MSVFVVLLVFNLLVLAVLFVRKFKLGRGRGLLIRILATLAINAVIIISYLSGRNISVPSMALGLLSGITLIAWESDSFERKALPETGPETLTTAWDDKDDLDGKSPLFEKKLYARACSYMEQKRPFLVDAFSLDDLSSALYTNKQYLSKTINHYSKGNFRQFVNHYRVKYAIGLFEKNMSLKVSEMSELSGFHNVVTFNTAFKLMMGETPSSWCRRKRTLRILGK